MIYRDRKHSSGCPHTRGGEPMANALFAIGHALSPHPWG